MKVGKDIVVSLSYTLYKDDENGEILEVCSPEKPLEFIFGSGMLLPKFEKNVANLSISDDFDFVLSPDEAYGERTNDAIVELPISIFTVDGKVKEDILFVGNTIPMRDTNGNPLLGTVTRVDKDVVVMDFNHPMAGTTLYFSGKIENLREATEEEKKNGLKKHCCGGKGHCGGHGEGHCGGHSDGGCGGGCGDDEDCGGCGGCH